MATERGGGWGALYNVLADRRTDKWTDRQADSETSRQAFRQTERQADR
jgi:hypothetical protein